MMSNLNNCNEYLPTHWLCHDITVTKRTNHLNCETQLFFNITQKIPETCTTKKLLADIEVWHKIQSNEWLYILSKPTMVNILCRNSDDAEERLQMMGTLHLDSDCKAYTGTTMLEAEAISGSTNVSHKIPPLDITQDDCCVKLRENVTLDHIKLQPIQLNNLNLDELKYAQRKLDDIDEILQQQINQPFLMKHSNWFTTILTTIGTGFSLIILYKVLKWLGFFSLIYRYVCCNQAPTDTNKASPCVQVFTHCFNKPQESRCTEFKVHYEAELERLNDPSMTARDQDQCSQGSLRRSTRTTRSTSGMKVTSK